MTTEIIDAMPNLKGMDQQQFAQAPVAQARSEDVELLGPSGLLTGLTKSVLQTALETALTEHLGYDQYEAAGRDGGNSRNGARTRGLTTEEISAHSADVYGATVSKDTISRIADKVLEEMAGWRGRPP